MTTNPRTILITGCSAHGIGAALALNLARRGHFIFATARSPTKVPESLTSLENVQVLPLDVTDPITIADAVRAVTDHGRGLDILVNNAGAGYTMPILESDLDQAMNLYDTHVLGLLRLVQACSDLLVTSKGRIINVSSAAAAVNTPWLGVYSSSKAAVTQLSETLRLEMVPFGVSVVCIMAGNVTSAFHANEPGVVLSPTSRYAAARQAISNRATGRDGLEKCSADEFAASIVDEVLGTAGGVVWRGPYSATVRFLARWCPTVLLDCMVSNGQGLDLLAK
ncbi:dehydrogenase with different specificitie [Aspergillus steynii IBT 23096]|uniref:Dehydrogenase with different specificitie n=1 Tax=Aspergillus steynii IBT 23096 TaxID=1392250 RepID=A0A2I2GF70_9EURO|nr:dehydrogenase with different specificitie [Aspergillus steynii IBT 23096]PLB51533.1 dehydrogenase with different specificitie [Aspergillus steynii IBT 23096]